MKNVWDQLRLKGIEPWDYETARRAEEGMPEHEARSFVIMRWMKAGDFRPLLAAIRKTGLLRGPTLGLLAEMLETGQLAFKKGRGRRHDPEAAVRDQFAADTYEHFSDPDDDGVKAVMRSDDLFSTIGSVISKSEESVRQAVTSRRKPKRR